MEMKWIKRRHKVKVKKKIKGERMEKNKSDGK